MSADPRAHELAVVVGGSGAIGREIVARLLSAGLAVLVVARTEPQAGAAKGDTARLRFCQADISCEEAVDRIRAAVSQPVRMVVHAAGVPVAGGVLEAPTAALAQAFNVKACGMVRLVRAVEDRLMPGSRLVAIGGHYGFEPTAYAATAGAGNAALVNLMRQYSWALGPRGVTAHVVAPGPADTERLRAIAARRAASLGIEPEQVLAELRAESAIGSFTTPAQVAWAVAMLLAPEADALAGSTLMLDSGRRRGLP